MLPERLLSGTLHTGGFTLRWRESGAENVLVPAVFWVARENGKLLRGSCESKLCIAEIDHYALSLKV